MWAYYVGRLALRQLSRVPMLLHINRRKQRDPVSAKRVFAKTLCDGLSPELVLEHQKSAGFPDVGHQSKLYVRRKFAAPLRRARVISINPTILQYRSEHELQAAEHRKEGLRWRRLAALDSPPAGFRGMFA
jgi:hypothetical protein